MPCLQLYRADLSAEKIICLYERKTERREEVSYSQWYEDRLLPMVSKKIKYDYEAVQNAFSLSTLRNNKGLDVQVLAQSSTDGRWIEVRGMWEANGAGLIILINDIHEWIRTKRRQERLRVYHFFRTRVEQLKQKGFYCGMLILKMDSDCSLCYAEKEAMDYLAQEESSSILAEMRRRIEKTFSSEAKGSADPYDTLSDCLDINIGETGEQRWLQFYGKNVVTERGHRYKYLLYVDSKPGLGKPSSWIRNEDQLIERAEGYLFEWNIEEDLLSLSSNWNSKFQIEPDRQNRRSRGWKYMEDYACEHDRTRLRKFFNSILSGENQDNILVRFRIDGKEIRHAWCSVNLLTVLYDKRVPMYVVGIVKDINEKLKEVLESSLECYGYCCDQKVEEARTYVNTNLSLAGEEDQHAILLIHLDYHFPADEAGGLDIMMYQFIEILAKMTYPEDRVWMEHGDLAVFLNHIGSLQNAKNKSRRIYKTFERMAEGPMRIDIGIAMYPAEGDSCRTLLENARKRLLSDIQLDKEGDDLKVGYHDIEYGRERSLSLISDIVTEWNRMIRMNNLLEKKMRMTEAQMMLNQIKPHFIYNVLANIKSLIYRDPKRAETVIVAFTRFLRIQLSTVGKERAIPFPQILDFIRDYVEIESCRYPGKFEVIYNIQYQEFMMPHFILQPLVENAIKHGMKNLGAVEHILISSRLEGDHIVIEVQDDGVGFDMDARPDENEEKRVGLENVRARISSLLHGSLHIYSKPGVGTTAVVTMPNGD